MASQLTTGQASGTQTATQNPQSVTATGGSGVQPGTANGLLKSTGGIPLSQTALTTVGLSGVSQGSSSQTAQPAPITHHHIDAAFLIVPGLLIVAALVAFWITGRSVKNTTHYS